MIVSKSVDWFPYSFANEDDITTNRNFIARSVHNELMQYRAMKVWDLINETAHFIMPRPSVKTHSNEDVFVMKWKKVDGNRFKVILVGDSAQAFYAGYSTNLYRKNCWMNEINPDIINEIKMFRCVELYSSSTQPRCRSGPFAEVMAKNREFSPAIQKAWKLISNEGKEPEWPTYFGIDGRTFWMKWCPEKVKIEIMGEDVWAELRGRHEHEITRGVFSKGEWVDNDMIRLVRSELEIV